MDPLSDTIRVLYVDPDRSVADEMATALEREDERLDVTTEPSAREGLARLAEDDFDGVVSEYEMPDVNGLEFLETVREDHDDLPFILFTGKGSEEVASEAISAGVTDYVQKTSGAERPKALANRIVNGAAQYDADRQAAETDRRFRALTETTNDVLWMFTPDFSELLFINSAYEDIWGRSADVLAEDPTDFIEGIHPKDRERVQTAMEKLAGGESIDLEYRVNAEEDFRRWVWVQGEPVYENGTLTRVAGFVRDITERKEYERQLEEAKEDLERSNQSLREFAYIASHDLQEPLRMVSSYVGLLEDEYGDRLDGEAEEYMEFAVDGARRMKRMINSLLQYSRVHTKAGAVEPTNTNEILEDVTRDLKFLIEDHDAEVSVGELPTVGADANQLAQVFQNLVKNAIEHAGGEETVPRVEVTASEREDAYEFSVADNGPGIPEAEQSEVFKIFRRGTEASGTDGTGIGLAISQRIVQRHGGEIWVDSEPGQGATFTFTLPKDLAERQESG